MIIFSLMVVSVLLIVGCAVNPSSEEGFTKEEAVVLDENEGLLAG